MEGMFWKRNLDEVLDRRRRFLGRRMTDSILVTIPVELDLEERWRQFERRWPQYPEGDDRPFPCNEEIFDRETIGLAERAAVEDDHLPAVYSILDAGESMVAAMFDSPMRFLHRPRGPAVSKGQPLVSDYAADLDKLHFSLENPWTRRFLAIQDHFRDHAGGRFAQHPCLTMDALNFACEIREASAAYLDVYAETEGLRRLMEIGLDFNIRFQEAQMARTGGLAGGCFEWQAGWAPFPRAVSLSVDAYVICSVKTYAELGFEYQSRLLRHFGHGMMHFHCNRADLAAEVAKLPGLELFQFGGDTRDPVPSLDRIPEIRRAVGDIPIKTEAEQGAFLSRLERGELPPNVWYCVMGPPMSIDQANRVMDKVRAYRA